MVERMTTSEILERARQTPSVRPAARQNDGTMEDYPAYPEKGLTAENIIPRVERILVEMRETVHRLHPPTLRARFKLSLIDVVNPNAMSGIRETARELYGSASRLRDVLASTVIFDLPLQTLERVRVLAEEANSLFAEDAYRRDRTQGGFHYYSVKRKELENAVAALERIMQWKRERGAASTLEAES